MARSLFLRGLAIVYLIAFISLLLQVNGLIGSNGILPVSDYLDTIDSEYGNTGYALFPTLAWFDSSDTFLHVMIWAGIALAIALLCRHSAASRSDRLVCALSLARYRGPGYSGDSEARVRRLHQR